jgi:uncharacterized protein YlxP (DUF503 family)
MIVGVRQWELQLYGCHSLKDKRSVLQSLKAALRNGLNIAVAETAHQDAWQRAEIACTTVASDRKVAEEVLRSADRIVEKADGVRIIDTVTSFI